MGPSIFGLQFLLRTMTAFLPAKRRDLPPASFVILLVVPVWQMRWEGPPLPAHTPACLVHSVGWLVLENCVCIGSTEEFPCFGVWGSRGEER